LMPNASSASSRSVVVISPPGIGSIVTDASRAWAHDSQRR
jgi:hypothetical protein